MKHLRLLTLLCAAITLVSCSGSKNHSYEGRDEVIGQSFSVKYEVIGQNYTVRFKNQTGGWETEYPLGRWWEKQITLKGMDFAKVIAMKKDPNDGAELTVNIYVNRKLCKTATSSWDTVMVDCYPMNCD
jgi:hypothetical protein